MAFRNMQIREMYILATQCIKTKHELRTRKRWKQLSAEKTSLYRTDLLFECLMEKVDQYDQKVNTEPYIERRRRFEKINERVHVKSII